MDKIDREDAAEPTTAGAVPDTGHANIDDDVTAPVEPEYANAGNGGPAIISNLSENEIVSARLFAREDDALEPGFILRDRFEIVELVHSGGMGRVYKALDNRRNRSASDQVHVAIKMMRREMNPDFDGRLALEREAARTQQLSHPNIVNVYDFDQHDEQFFIVMEWLEGESLNAMLRRTSGRGIATDFAWRIVEDIASGLQHAHEHDLIHADINPSNVFITVTQEIKLLDFGVARLADNPENESDNDVVWVTHSYASPEVLTGAVPGFEDDIFSVGCIAYRALAGRHPFGGKPSIQAKQQQLRLEPIPGLPDPYWKVLQQSLSLDSAERPSSASVFFVDRSAPDDPADRKRRAGARWLAAAVLAILVSAAGYWWLQAERADTISPAPAITPTIDEAVAVSADPIPEPSPLQVLLDDAGQAMEMQQFVTPEGDSARDLYLEALDLEPGNAAAMAGLREISNRYVTQAEDALRAGDSDAAASTFGIAEETDPENPALEIVRELLLAQANSALANAQVAAIEGEVTRAEELLLQAERYAVIDAASIEGVRARIDRTRQEQALLDLVAQAESNIAAGNLIAPAEDNAHTQLLALQQSYGDEPRVRAAIERLVERLLNRAAFATAAEQFPVAAELLDAAAEFGVLESDVAAARTWLQQAIDLASEPDRATPAGLVVAATEPEVDGIPDTGLAAGAADGPDALPADEGIPDTGTTNVAAGAAPPQPEQLVQFSELEIENYVAPRYPSRASETGMSGIVDLHFDVNPNGGTGNIQIVNAEPDDIFVPSAINAVRQWRFAARDDAVRARVRLRFDPLQPQ